MADEPSVKAGTGEARLLLKTGEKAMRGLLMAFDHLSERIYEGEVPADRELARVCVTLAKVRATLMEEIQKHERRVLMSDGLTDEAPIDFDAIRTDIGRRIDRLVEQDEDKEIP